MNSPYQQMNTAALVDLLARETQKFTQLMMERQYTDEYYRSKSAIQELQGLIENRKLVEAPPRD